MERRLSTWQQAYKPLRLMEAIVDAVFEQGGSDEDLNRLIGDKEMIGGIAALIVNGRNPVNIESVPVQKSEWVKLGPCAFNVVTGRLTGNEISGRLSPLEGRLLKFLLAHTDKPVPVCELMKIWEGEANERMVVAAVLRLRRRLGAAGDYLVTVRNEGYWLRVPAQ